MVVSHRLPRKLQVQCDLFCDGHIRSDYHAGFVSLATKASRLEALTSLLVVICFTLYRNWETFERIRQAPGNGTMLFRIAVFSLAPTTGLV